MKNFIVAFLLILGSSSFTSSTPPEYSSFAVIDFLVVDKCGDPIPGASVRVAGTPIGTITNLYGQAVLDIPIGTTVIVSFLGCDTVQIVVTTTPIVIELDCGSC